MYTGSGLGRFLPRPLHDYRLREIELWVDGVKLAEQYNGWDKYAWFDFSHSFDPGTHQVNIFSAGYDNALQHTALSFRVP